MILTHGTADRLISPYNTIDYYNRQVRPLGQSAIGSFVCFYMVSGSRPWLGSLYLAFDDRTALDD